MTKRKGGNSKEGFASYSGAQKSFSQESTCHALKRAEASPTVPSENPKGILE